MVGRCRWCVQDLKFLDAKSAEVAGKLEVALVGEAKAKIREQVGARHQQQQQESSSWGVVARVYYSCWSCRVMTGGVVVFRDGWQYVSWLNSVVATEKSGKRAAIDEFLDQTASQVRESVPTHTRVLSS